MILAIDGYHGFRLGGFVAAILSHSCSDDSHIDTVVDILKIGAKRLHVVYRYDFTSGWLNTIADASHSVSYNAILGSIDAIVDNAGLNLDVVKRGLKALDVILGAECKFHCHDNKEELHLHEARGSIPLFIAASYLCHVYKIDWIHIYGTLHYGSGRISFSHGEFMLPAPATRIICHRYGIPIAEGDIEGELLTPSGAAFLATFTPNCLLFKDQRRSKIKWLEGYDSPNREDRFRVLVSLYRQ